jgi:hypothetical protein
MKPGTVCLALLAFSSCTRAPSLENSLDGTWDLSLPCLTDRQIVVQIRGENSVWEDTDTSTGCVVTRTIKFAFVSTSLIRLVEPALPTCSTPACSNLCTDPAELANWSYDFADSIDRKSFSLTARFTGIGYENEGACGATTPNTTTFTLSP